MAEKTFFVWEIKLALLERTLYVAEYKSSGNVTKIDLETDQWTDIHDEARRAYGIAVLKDTLLVVEKNYGIKAIPKSNEPGTSAVSVNTTGLESCVWFTSMHVIIEDPATNQTQQMSTEEPTTSESYEMTSTVPMATSAVIGSQSSSPPHLTTIADDTAAVSRRATIPHPTTDDLTDPATNPTQQMSTVEPTTSESYEMTSTVPMTTSAVIGSQSSSPSNLTTNADVTAAVSRRTTILRPTTDDLTVTASAITNKTLQEKLEEFDRKIEAGNEDGFDLLVKLENLNWIEPDFKNDSYQLEGFKFFDLLLFKTSPESDETIAISTKNYTLQVSFPDNALGLEDGFVRIVVLNTELLPTRNNTPTHFGDGEPTTNYLIGSRLVSITIFSASRPVPYNGEKPFFITHQLLPLILEEDNLTQPSCQFLDQESWSRKGCQVADFNHTHVKCECDHMTTFSVLMSFEGVNNQLEYALAVTVLYYIGSALSIASLLFALTTFILFRGIPFFGEERIVVHKHLMAATLLALHMLMISNAAKNNAILCKVVAILLQCSFFAVFSWTLVEAIHLYRLIIVVYGTDRSLMVAYYLIGWGLPVLMTGVSVAVGHDLYGNTQQCWLSDTRGFRWAFLGPVLMIILINITILAAVTYKTVRAATVTTHQNIALVKVGLRTIFFLLPILGVGWIAGFAANYNIYASYAFDIFSSLQGVFVVAVCCVFNSEVRNIFKREWGRYLPPVMANRVAPMPQVLSYTSELVCFLVSPEVYCRLVLPALQSSNSLLC